MKWLRLTALWLLAVTIAVASPGCPDPGPPGPDGGRDGGDGGETPGPYALSVLDGIPTPLLEDFTPQVSAAVGPGDKIGVAYFRTDAAVAADGGIETYYDVDYLEWQGGQVTRRERVQTVFNVNGLSLAFQGNGEPAVAYLGGPWRQAESVYWRNSDAVVSYRQAGGTWVEQTAVLASGEAPAGNGPSDTGYLVGLYPALAFDGARAYLAYRDGHFGQSIGTGDYNSSDLELAEGGPTAWGHVMLQAGGNDKQAWGGHTQMIMAGGQPALVMDKVAFAATGIGHDIYFLRRSAAGTWTYPPVRVAATSDSTSGASLAHDTGTRFGVAFSDRVLQALYFADSTNDGASWNPRDVAFQSGSGGWYPSLLFEPTTHNPVIAFHLCSARTGVTQVASCPEAEDELRLIERIGGQWYETSVDPAGGFQPRLMRLSTGQRVIVYRDPRSGTVKLAEER